MYWTYNLPIGRPSPVFGGCLQLINTPKLLKYYANRRNIIKI